MQNSKLPEYLGFGHSSKDGIIKVYRDAETQSNTVVHATLSDLSETEAKVLELDQSPALYHWNDLLFVSGPNNHCEVVYCRGKDLIPFDGLDYVEQIRTAVTKGDSQLFTLQIQPNQVCNDACVFCCTANYRERPIYKGIKFSLDELRELVETFARRGGKVVEIIGGGEPTLHPKFIELMDIIAELGLKVYLFTNGSQFGNLKGELNKPLLGRIAKTCCVLNVSLDGYRSREAVHTKLSFRKTELTFEGMRYIHSIRDRREMGFYNSYILTGGKSQAPNIQDLEECISLQAGWVDSIHVQNDFVSNSHLEFDIEPTRQILQSVIDTYMSKIYIYYNYPLISRFGLKVPYQLSLHNVHSDTFSHCWRGRLAPTVECGTNKVWPCGKYSGEGNSSDYQEFKSFERQLDNLLTSPDYKNTLSCAPCIHSSYNHALLEIEKCIRKEPEGRFFHFYEKR